MKKVKVAELSGAALDWAVAKCEGLTFSNVSSQGDSFRQCHKFFDYSTNWSQGGPIIEREGIETRVHVTHNNTITSWAAEKDWPMCRTEGATGPTLLIAAMRCYVTSKIGDNVDIPEELL